MSNKKKTGLSYKKFQIDSLVKGL